MGSSGRPTGTAGRRRLEASPSESSRSRRDPVRLCTPEEKESFGGASTEERPGNPSPFGKAASPRDRLRKRRERATASLHLVDRRRVSRGGPGGHRNPRSAHLEGNRGLAAPS